MVNLLALYTLLKEYKREALLASLSSYIQILQTPCEVKIPMLLYFPASAMAA